MSDLHFNYKLQRDVENALTKDSQIPIICSINLPDFNPWQYYRHAQSGAYNVLLESFGDGEANRYSIIGCQAEQVLRLKDNVAETIDLKQNKRTSKRVADPFFALEEFVGTIPKVKDPKLPFINGAVVCLAYECLHVIEEVPRLEDKLNLPDVAAMICREWLIYDHQEQKLFITRLINNPAEWSPACRDLENKARQIALTNQYAAMVRPPKEHTVTVEHLQGKSNIGGKFYQHMVQQAKHYIEEGEIYQVNLSHRLTYDFEGSPFDLYEALREINPSPFNSFFQFGDLVLASCSPERLVKVHGRQVETRPIAGTRQRHSDQAKDQALSAELLISDKERAEHIMLVDLERNDLGRVCESGSVKVARMMAVESYSHVHHIVSTVIGKLLPNKSWVDVIKAVFPGGTITGTPKVRAMEIIAELENDARGPYTGSLGWISANGDMDLNILIRTMVLTGRKAHIQVGAGIVADSVPENEFKETLYKGLAMIEALKTVG